jgi:hypothetical protein
VIVPGPLVWHSAELTTQPSTTTLDLCISLAETFNSQVLPQPGQQCEPAFEDDRNQCISASGLLQCVSSSPSQHARPVQNSDTTFAHKTFAQKHLPKDICPGRPLLIIILQLLTFAHKTFAQKDVYP